MWLRVFVLFILVFLAGPSVHATRRFSALEMLSRMSDEDQIALGSAAELRSERMSCAALGELALSVVEPAFGTMEHHYLSRDLYVEFSVRTDVITDSIGPAQRSLVERLGLRVQGLQVSLAEKKKIFSVLEVKLNEYWDHYRAVEIMRGEKSEQQAKRELKSLNFALEQWISRAEALLEKRQARAGRTSLKEAD